MTLRQASTLLGFSHPIRFAIAAKRATGKSFAKGGRTRSWSPPCWTRSSPATAPRRLLTASPDIRLADIQSLKSRYDEQPPRPHAHASPDRRNRPPGHRPPQARLVAHLPRLPREAGPGRSSASPLPGPQARCSDMGDMFRKAWQGVQARDPLRKDPGPRRPSAEVAARVHAPHRCPDPGTVRRDRRARRSSRSSPPSTGPCSREAWTASEA